ncbi:MAG: hypothetical protein KGS72_07875 [Cyanobacteria bacterium REEB67]|nr:hypothetical protein [Cyanobacteria bacterium REEB67]
MHSISALRDADTCWLLALGKIIAQTGLPTTEPFSYTYYLMTQTGIAHPFILHQWLAELIFYKIFQLAGLGGLGLLVALLTSLSLVAVPALAHYKEKVSIPMAMLIGTFAQLGCAFRSYARPEIFTYLLFALSLYLIESMTKSARRRACASYCYIAIYAAITATWANLHSSFILAVCLSFLPLIAALANNFFTAAQAKAPEAEKNSSAKTLLPLVLLPVTTILATLVNPAGINLWTYLPYLYFMKVAITEARTLNLDDLHLRGFVPYFVLFPIYIITLIRYLRKFAGQKDASFFLHCLGAILALTLACNKIRLIIYILIIIAYELPLLLTRLSKQAGDQAEVASSTTKQVWFKSPFLVLLAPLTCLIGSFYVTAFVHQSRLPEPSPSFDPPYDAIVYLRDHRPTGPVFNDHRFGDMMIWYLKPPVPVFIDTRIDMYGDQFCLRYAAMCNCQNNWRQDLDEFGINYVFLPPNTPLVQTLAKDPGWSTIFADKTAVILQRR